MLLAGLTSIGFTGERYFEAFCTDKHGAHRAVAVPEWLALPELRSLVGTLTPEFLTSYGIHEMVRTPFGLSCEARSKVWKLLEY
jgi:hypothetical protein